MVSCKFHHQFGLSIESVQSQPVLGWTNDTQTIHEAQVYFFDGIILNFPFLKIHIGEVFDFFQ